MLGMSDHEIDGHSTWKWSEDTRDRKTLSPVLLLKNIYFYKNNKIHESGYCNP